MASQLFRSVERQTSWRANILLLECALILMIHLIALHKWVQPCHQRSLLALFAIVYIARLNLMARWLLPRELSTEELTFVMLVWLPSILASFTYGTIQSSGETGLTSIQLSFASAGYLGGSFLNTFSELQRKWWKAKAENKSRCYMLGLFSISRNVNYFGDVVLFGAWALATGSLWNIWVPLAMFLSFYFFHIPEKEAYLAKRYSDDWPSYKASTKALIPWLL